MLSFEIQFEFSINNINSNIKNSDNTISVDNIQSIKGREGRNQFLISLILFRSVLTSAKSCSLQLLKVESNF